MRRALILIGLIVLSASWSTPAGAQPAAPIRLTLDDAVARLRADAPSARQLAARVEEARATVRLATAAVLPVLAAQGGYTRNNADARVDIKSTFDTLAGSLPIPGGLDTSALPGELIIQPLEVWSVGAQLTVPLIAPSAWADITAASAAAHATAAQRDAAIHATESALVRAAWSSGAAAQRVAAAAHAEEVARTHLGAAERRLDAGLGTDLEVLAARTELDRRASERLQAEADLAVVHRAIGALIGTGGAVVIALPDPDEGPTPSTDEAAAAAVAFRPELQAATWSWKAAHRQATSAWLRHLPTVSATGSLAAQTVDFPTGLPNAWRVGVQASWVFYDGGARYGLLRQARAREDLAAAARDQATLDAAREAIDAVDGVAVAAARRRLAQSALRTADSAEAAATRAYAAGLIGSADLLDAQQRRYDAALAQAAADAQLGIARAELVRTTGQAR